MTRATLTQLAALWLPTARFAAVSPSFAPSVPSPGSSKTLCNQPTLHEPGPGWLAIQRHPREITLAVNDRRSVLISHRANRTIGLLSGDWGVERSDLSCEVRTLSASFPFVSLHRYCPASRRLNASRTKACGTVVSKHYQVEFRMRLTSEWQ
jgi:hypothetical protein